MLYVVGMSVYGTRKVLEVGIEIVRQARFLCDVTIQFLNNISTVVT